jgi:AcrR family transcriptional regulator
VPPPVRTNPIVGWRRRNDVLASCKTNDRSLVSSGVKTRGLPVAPPTRTRILETALELFAKRGFAGTSIRRLARRVGVRESSLYNHFSGKGAILTALVDEYGPASSAHRLDTPRYQALRDDPQAFCRQYADDLLEQWHDERERRFQELVTAERNRVPELRARFAEQLFSREEALVARFFEEFARAGLITTPDVEEAARLLMAGLTFVRLKHYTIPASLPAKAEVKRALDRFLASFLALVAPRRRRDAGHTRARTGGRHGKVAAGRS